MVPIAELDRLAARRVQYVLFDIDDTITEDGYLLPESFCSIWKLSRAGLACVPVTGRPAGWCDLIARQWPIAGVVGENGAFAFYQVDGTLERLYHPNAGEPAVAAGRLATLRAGAAVRFPGLRVAKDQAYRLFDLALDFAEEEPKLDLAYARELKAYCESEGAVAKISSIHVNAWYGDYDKLSMAELFLSRRYGFDPATDEASVLYVGDSPNDEPMFKRFSYSCGVQNVCHYEGLLQHPPRYVASKPYGYGFDEIATLLLALRTD